ncbi:hypothetical protein V2J09_015548 [Rumex salicifolius]
MATGNLCFLFFFFFLISSTNAKATAAGTPCDDCYHHSKATYYSKASAISSGACGYGSVALNYYGGHIAAASPAFFKDGSYCGACFQVRCMNKSLCSKKGTNVVVTDLHQQKGNNSTDLVLSSRAFKAMANTGLDSSLLKLALVDVEFKRIPCEYKSKNLAVRVEEYSRYPDKLAFTVLFQGGQTEIRITEVAQVGSSKWSGMERSHGAVWNTTRSLNGPLQLRFVVTMGYDAKYIWAQHALPAQWRPGSIYETDVQIDDLNIGDCYPCEPSRLGS